MGLISKYVYVELIGNNIKYYESLGYNIPKHKDEKGRIKIKRGTKIKVKVEDLQKWSNIKVKVKCDNPNCGKEYEINYSDYSKYNHDGKYYCNKCASKIFNSRENNSRWNPNKTQEEREMGRNYPEYTEFIRKVIARDNYTCQCCGNKNTKHDVEVHHLDGYDWCKEKRIDETNGVTLCETCHKNFHSIYGYGNNTKEQFEEWYGKAVELVKYEGEMPIARKVYCIEEDKVYNSTKQLADEWNCDKTQIHNICNHKPQSNGYYCKSLKNKHLLWLDEYEKCSEDDVQKYLEWCKPNLKRDNLKGKNNPIARKVICITTGKIFETIKEANEFYNINCSHISDCCKGKRNYCGKLKDGTKLVWEYY